MPHDCARAVAAGLPAGLRLVGITAEQDEQVVAVTVRVGGRERPATTLTGALVEVIAQQLRRPVRMHLVHEWEDVASSAAPR